MLLDLGQMSAEKIAQLAELSAALVLRTEEEGLAGDTMVKLLHLRTMY